MKKTPQTIHPLVRQLLENRGITTEVEMVHFLNPDYVADLHDPFLLKDMGRSVDRVLKAIKDKEKIVLFTDYDTDGIPSGVILFDFFTKISYENFINYVPHRHKEGYGLNCEAIDGFAKDGATLLITADCAITDNEEVAHAQELGIDVIVTDHHLTGDELPPAFAVINPKRDDCEYPFDMLCGCGVAFKLITALIKTGNERGMFEIKAGWEKWLLDMVGISTVCDMVPLVGENRTLAYYGLKVLRKSPRPGIVSLLRKVRVAQPLLSEDDVGFTIGPRINAASRMDVPRRAFEMLASSDESEAVDLVSFLDKLNTRRKTLVAFVMKQAHGMLAERELRDVIVMGNPDWAPGILGLVANSIAKQYQRPTFLWGRGEEGGTIKGSCRSDGTISVVDCLAAAETDAILGFGGHSASGGFSVAGDKIHTLEEALLKAYSAIRKVDISADETQSDGELSIDQVNWETFGIIDQLAPFGMSNPRPIFTFPQQNVSAIRWFGKEKNHLELTFRTSWDSKVLAIAFFATENDSFKDIEEGVNITLLACVERNFFMGKREIRLKIMDIKK